MTSILNIARNDTVLFAELIQSAVLLIAVLYIYINGSLVTTTAFQGKIPILLQIVTFCVQGNEETTVDVVISEGHVVSSR